MTSFSENILGYEIDKRALPICLDEMAGWVEKGDHCRWFACFNPHSYVVARKDEVFAKALRGPDWLVPDGVGVVIASKFLGGNIQSRITGFDIFNGLLTRLNQKGSFGVFFLGASEETLSAIQERMKVDYPNLKVVGTFSPPFKPEFTPSEIGDMVSAINSAKPDVLWVGMTAPKQEKWIFENRNRLNVKFAGAIGAVFDFYTGRVKRAHPVFQKLGLEWLVRLVKEPRRMWRRYLVNTFIFLWCLLSAKNFGSKPKG